MPTEMYMYVRYIFINQQSSSAFQKLNETG